MQRPEFYASQAHYADHLVPIWRALGSDAGVFHASTRAGVRLDSLDVPWKATRPGPGDDLVVVAGYSDVRLCRHRPLALLEHGAGQSYETGDPCYSGGGGREGVALHLVPNEIAAERNRRRYPLAVVAVVGCPKLDAWQDRKPEGRAVVLSFHWPARLADAPEASWALPHYQQALPGLVAALTASGIEVLGHGHPRARSFFRRLWAQLGVEALDHFDDVLTRAGVYVCDNSSTLYEAAAVGIPVVVLDAPWYRPDVDLWPRFWACADVGVRISDPAHLQPAVLMAMVDPPAVAKRRRAAVAEVYPLLDGKAAQRSAEAILAVASSVP